MNSASEAQFGAHTFGETVKAAGAGRPSVSTLSLLVEQAVLSEQVGLDFFGVGEHHGPGFEVSQPDLILAAIAGRTDRIRLGTAVGVLSVQEPLFMYERFATLDVLSGGRADLAVGPGAFADIFEMLGVDYAHRVPLYERRLDELLELVESHTSVGSTSPRPVIPRAVSDPMTLRVASSGTEGTMTRAAERGLPVMVAVREGDPRRFAHAARNYFDHFRRHPHRQAEVTLHVSGFIGDSLDSARRLAWPYVREVMSTLGARRGWDPLTKAQFDEATTLGGPMLIGPPELVAEKIVRSMRALGATRFALKYGIGSMPHELLTANITRLGTQVVPMVKASLREPARSG
ncbi:LLM class flavin-dependent oxidoreductase [Leifsonia sp. Leaf336]|uniref:LLM class flavin-dependent oxidoreductase n=1 Tax=Leifsonia sp. Leaf336 TaxID=1736341 RepID=UPI000B334F39|nr:LLM class flavin-dependent oxidoreductase [Leifsonia sp. Leaf336]